MKKVSIFTLTAVLAALVMVAASCSTSTTPSVTTSSVAVRLVFATQPVGSDAGSALSVQPVVVAQDANGNTVTGYTFPVALTIASDTGTKGAVLYGGRITNAIKGVADFEELYLNLAGSGYRLTATSRDLPPVTSAPFDIDPGAAAKLAFTISPSGGLAGVAFTTQPEVIVQDRYGNTVTGYQGSVSLVVTPNSGPPQTISGTATVAVVDSVARFTDLSMNIAYPGYTLTATSGSLEPGTSRSFTIMPGAAVKLEFTVPVDGAVAGTEFYSQPKVAVEDVYGNVVKDVTVDIIVSITPDTGTPGAVLSGTTTVLSDGGLGGLAEFYDLSVDLAGSGYTLTANSGQLAPAVSLPFDVAVS